MISGDVLKERVGSLGLLLILKSGQASFAHNTFRIIFLVV
jgi:hypothetical protein